METHGRLPDREPRKVSIKRKLESAIFRLAPAELAMTERSFKDLPSLQSLFHGHFLHRSGLQARRRCRRRGPVCEVGLQSIHPWWPEECNHLGGGLNGQNSFMRKPSAIIGPSPGLSAPQSLRNPFGVLAFCNSPQMNTRFQGRVLSVLRRNASVESAVVVQSASEQAEDRSARSVVDRVAQIYVSPLPLVGDSSVDEKRRNEKFSWSTSCIM